MTLQFSSLLRHFGLVAEKWPGWEPGHCAHFKEFNVNHEDTQ